MRASARSLGARLAGVLLLATLHAGAARGAPTGNEGSRIQPVGERRLAPRSRATVRRAQDTKLRDARATRVSLQIPEFLRASLEKKIDQRIASNIAETKRLRSEAKRLLQKFIQEVPEGSLEMPEALLRIGELEWEDARDDFLLAFRRWDAAPSDQRGEPPNPDYTLARARFARVLRDYKNFRDYDLALYVDGFLANEERKFDEALARFNTILAGFPQSRFSADAHMARAEYQFTKPFPDYALAYEEYEQVLKHRRSELYEIALFKSAWALWRLGKTEQAAQRFLIVFKETSRMDSRARRRSELGELQAEALKNLVAVFAEDENNRADDMYRFLVKAGGERFAGRIVLSLAEAFFEQAQYERGIEAYRLLLKLEPASPRGYYSALSIARGHSTLDAFQRLVDDYRWILRDFTLDPAAKGAGGAWARNQPATVRAASEHAIERQLRNDAISLHAKAQADKISRAEFEAAAELYSIYLSRFAARSDAWEIYFNLGEVAFYRLGDPRRAVDAYLASVRLNPRGKLARDALYNALAALEQVLLAELRSGAAERSKGAPSTHERLTRAMELYLQTYPNDPDLPGLLFGQGKLYYDFRVYDMAVQEWGLLLEKYPSSPFATRAGELILDSFNQSRDYANIEGWARRLKRAAGFQSADQQARLNGLIVQAVFKQGEALSQANQHAAAAAAYLRAAKEFPKDTRAAQAAVNAETEARKSGDLATLSAAAALLLDRYRQRPEAASGIWIAASTYQEVGLFAEAAKHYALHAERFPKSEQHKTASYNAVLLWTTLGDHAHAIESGQAHRRRYRNDETSDEVAFLMGKAHEKAEKWRDAEALYEGYRASSRNPNSRIEACVRLASVRIRRGDERGAAAALDQAQAVYRLGGTELADSGRYFAAKGRYLQGERILAQFSKIGIEGAAKQLKQRLRQKSELLKRAASIFLSTAEMGVAEWTTASLYQIGFAYQSFAKALLSSPPPPNLSAEERELYQQSIEEFVIPIEERGLEAYESGWSKAIELGIFNTWTAKMRAALAELNAELYPPLNEIGFELRSKSESAFPSLIDGLRRANDGRSPPHLVPLDSAEGRGSKRPEPEVRRAGGSP